MVLMDQEMEAEVFVWETSAETVAETAEESSEVMVTALRSTALDALDALEEVSPASGDDVVSAPTASLNIEVDDLSVEAASDFVAAAANTGTVDEADTPASEALEVLESSTTSDDADHVAACMALLNEKYPDGIEVLFGNGVAEGLFALVWGKGPISGNEDWTNADDMLVDAVFMTMEDAGVDLMELWEDFTGDLVEKLFPDGFGTENLYTPLSQNGPISGLAEWTELDFQAFDLVKSLVWSEEFDGNWEDNSLEIFNDAYPDGILELFPDGFSDEAMQALLDGNGLYSGEADWTEEDTVIFEGLWQALQDQGIEPFAGDTEFTPMPIVIDDREWFLGEPDHPIMVVCDFWPPEPVVCDCLGPPELVVCDFTPPPEMVVCFPHEDMITI